MKRSKKVPKQPTPVSPALTGVPDDRICETAGTYAIPQEQPSAADVWKLLKEIALRDEERWAQEEKRRAEDEKRRAEEEKRRAEEYAKQRAEDEKRRAEEEKRRTEERQRDEEERRTDRKRMRELNDNFEYKWGRYIEALVRGQLIELLNERGIPVNQAARDVEVHRGGNNYEFDLIAENGITIVVVEVKTTLRPEDVPQFLERMKLFREIMPKYHDKVIYGALAFISKKADSDKMAENQGLFVIEAVGEGARITNKADFKPRAF